VTMIPHSQYLDYYVWSRVSQVNSLGEKESLHSHKFDCTNRGLLFLFPYVYAIYV